MKNQMDNRACQAGEGMSDSPASIQRAGGEDPRRREVNILIERKVKDNDMSGYNHNGVSDSSDYSNGMDRKAASMGTPNPDGTRS